MGSWTSAEKGQSVRVNTTSADNSYDIMWQKNSPGIMGWGGSASIKKDTSKEKYSARIERKGYRGRVRAYYDETHYSSASRDIERKSRYMFDTSIAYVDGNIGLSLPIENGFAMIVPQNQWKDRFIGVNGADNGYRAVADRWGPAIIHNLSPYRPAKAHLETPYMPLGIDIGKDRYILYPSYKSGTILYVGNEDTIVVEGTLVDVEGTPLALRAGEIICEDGTEETYVFFTNREGKFSIPKMRVGRFRIDLFGKEDATIFIIIPRQKKAYYNAGVITYPIGSKRRR
jgi:outer membrane usher protein